MNAKGTLLMPSGKGDIRRAGYSCVLARFITAIVEERSGRRGWVRRRRRRRKK